MSAFRLVKAVATAAVLLGCLHHASARYVQSDPIGLDGESIPMRTPTIRLRRRPTR